MATHIGIGFSQAANTTEATYQASLKALEQIQQDKIDLAILLNTIHYSPLEALITLKKTLNPERTIGCSTAGIILADRSMTQGLAVLTITSDELLFATGTANEIETYYIQRAGAAFGKNIITSFGPNRRQAFLFFIDGMIKNSESFIKGMQEVFGNVFPVVGAGSTDDFQFEEAHQYYQDVVSNHSACGVMFGSSSLKLGLSNKHGFKPLGKPRFITETKEHIIKTIDNQKAVNIYHEYFGEESKNLRTAQMSRLSTLYPLGIYLPYEKNYVLRNPLGILNDGSIICQAEVPEGAEVHIMIANKDACKQAALSAAREVREELAGRTPKFLFIIESLSRLKLLGRGAHAEIDAVREVFGGNVPTIGLYSHGEIAPSAGSTNLRKTHLQNQSITILGVG